MKRKVVNISKREEKDWKVVVYLVAVFPLTHIQRQATENCLCSMMSQPRLLWCLFIPQINSQSQVDSSPTSFDAFVVVQSLSHVCSFMTPWNVAYQAPMSMGFPRQEHWSGLPCPLPVDLPDSGTDPQSPALWAGSLPLKHQGSATSFDDHTQSVARTKLHQKGQSFPNSTFLGICTFHFLSYPVVQFLTIPPQLFIFKGSWELQSFSEYIYM